MSKIHNMVRVIGNPGSDEFVLPEGWKLHSVVNLGPTNAQEAVAGAYKLLYVLVPEVVAKRGRPVQHE